ncbi:MAG: hypothetical protein IJ717_08995 [Treponema sp.]|nr:hypothetical protein [Treponema sp.]
METLFSVLLFLQHGRHINRKIGYAVFFLKIRSVQDIAGVGVLRIFCLEFVQRRQRVSFCRFYFDSLNVVPGRDFVFLRITSFLAEANAFQNLSAIILQDKSVNTKKATAFHPKNKKA